MSKFYGCVDVFGFTNTTELLEIANRVLHTAGISLVITRRDIHRSDLGYFIQFALMPVYAKMFFDAATAYDYTPKNYECWYCQGQCREGYGDE